MLIHQGNNCLIFFTVFSFSVDCSSVIATHCSATNVHVKPPTSHLRQHPSTLTTATCIFSSDVSFVCWSFFRHGNNVNAHHAEATDLLLCLSTMLLRRVDLNFEKDRLLLITRFLFPLDGAFLSPAKLQPWPRKRRNESFSISFSTCFWAKSNVDPFGLKRLASTARRAGSSMFTYRGKVCR